MLKMSCACESDGEPQVYDVTMMKSASCEKKAELLDYFLKRIQGIVDIPDERIMRENSNKNGKIAPIQRDLVCGEASKFFMMHAFEQLPQNLKEAMNDNVIKWHDLDFGVQKIHNCCVLNLRDMLDNGTVLNKRMIDPPTNFLSACSIATQIVSATFTGQYGGTSMSLTPLAKYLRKSEQKFREEFGNEVVVQRLMKHELEQGIQTIMYQLNTLAQCAGQTPFTTVFMNINENPEYEKEMVEMTSEMISQCQLGMKDETGHYITMNFPKLIYVLDENNINESSKYFWLTQKAARCTSKRMNPDYISAKIMRQNYAGNVFSPMGCRSFLNPWKNAKGEYQFDGRCNMGVVTLNLPQIALEANGDFDKFWRLFDERMLLVKQALDIKYDYFSNATAEVSPIHFQYGAITRLQPNQKVSEVVSKKYATLAVGYIGIYEAVKHMTGYSSTSQIGKPFALDIIMKLRQRCDEWNAASDLQYSLYGTPSEATAGQMCESDLRKYGSVKDVTDKGWYTNSFHVDVREKINAYDKLAFEAQFQKYSSGGCISYVEIPNIKDNISAMTQMMQFIYNNIQYAEFNTKSGDYCRTCQFEGEILLDDNYKWYCPSCGERRESQLLVVRRTCGYIGENFWNEGKTKEIKDRQEHICVPVQRGIVDMDYANGDGLRTSIWFTGCPHQCPGCHNQHTWKFDPAFQMDVNKIIEVTRPVRKLSILGGEPMAQFNRNKTLEIIQRVRAEIPDCSIYLWTGYEKGALKGENDMVVNAIMKLLDKVIFGPFIIDLKVNNPYYGSSNQYIVEKPELANFFTE